LSGLADVVAFCSSLCRFIALDLAVISKRRRERNLALFSTPERTVEP
jgi:hypothetical protein